MSDRDSQQPQPGAPSYAPTPRYVYLPANLPLFQNLKDAELSDGQGDRHSSRASSRTSLSPAPSSIGGNSTKKGHSSSSHKSSKSKSKSQTLGTNSSGKSSTNHNRRDSQKDDRSVEKHQSKTSQHLDRPISSSSQKRNHIDRSLSPVSRKKSQSASYSKTKDIDISDESDIEVVKKKPRTDISRDASKESPPRSNNDREPSVYSSSTSLAPPSVVSKDGDESVTNLNESGSSSKMKKKKRRDHRYISKNASKPCIDSLTIIKNHVRSYIHMSPSEDAKLNSENIETVTLEYPGNTEVFPLVVPKKEEEYSPLHDIYTTTQMIASYCLESKDADAVGDSKHGILRSVIKYCHRRDVGKLKESISQFNEVMRSIKKRNGFEESELTGPAAPYPLITHILEQAYARSVAPNSHLLNKYEGFSNNVYGEIKQPFVHDLIKQANIRPHHVFLDMGSGIGNVVLQVAAETLCECYGIEIMETPARFAARQRSEFLSRMRYYSKPCGRIQLKRGDFLEDSEIYQIITKADVIFVNNYAFDAELNQNILARFLDLKESARVISLRSFVPVDRRPSLRRSNAIESIFTVKEYHFSRDSVSWMVDGGKYYIHTVDRSQLASLLE